MTAHRHPRPEILEAIPLDRPVVIEASAGTGKTYTLEHLVIELLLTKDVRLDQLLVVTFTEKAAAELKQRLRKKLEAMLRPEGDVTGGHWTIGPIEAQKVIEALHGFDGAAISTIHAFCQRLLVENAFAHRRLFEQALVDARSAFSDAFLLTLRDTLAKDARHRTYLDAFLGARTALELGELLFDVSVRRGTFKPRYDEAALERALDELTKIELTRAAVQPALRAVGLSNLQTVNAIFDRLDRLRLILHAYQQKRDLPGALLALGTEERQRGSGFLGYLIERIGPKVGTTGLLHRIVQAIEALAQVRVPFESAIAQLFLPLVSARLAAEKDRTGRFDFDDMLSLLQGSLTSAGGGALTQLVRRRYRWALIDEFQDTDEVQWSIFGHLFLDAGPDHGLVVIGDPKQAIYGFRGADLSTYLEAKSAIVARGGEVVPLIRNFRQTPALVGVLNDLFAKSRSPSFFTGLVGYDHPVVAGGARIEAIEADGAPLTSVEILELVPDHGPLSPSLAKEALAEKIATSVKSLLDGPVRLVEAGKAERIRPKDVFVLTRSGREGRQIARRLTAHRVPVAFFQQEGLFDTEEAKDVLAVLEAVAEPRDRQRVARALRTPFFAVPLPELDRAKGLGAEHPYGRLLERWHDLAEVRRHGELFLRILEESGIVERELLLAEEERALTNYLHLFEILEAEAGRRGQVPIGELISSLSAYVGGLRSPPGAEANVQRQGSTEDAVQVMTMHKAKGLEAAVVFLFGGFEAGPPGARIWHEGKTRLIHVGEGPPQAAEVEANEEDQRLLYVALTRAKARLYLPYFGAAENGERTVRNLEGPYRHLVEVLDPIVHAIKAGVGPSGIGIDVVTELRRRPLRSVAPEPTSLSSWRPDPSLLVAPAPSPRILALRAERAPVTITSYSRIKKGHAGDDRPPLDGFDVHVELPPEQLPAGAASGKFLHEILERVPLSILDECSDARAFCEHPEVARIAQEAMVRHQRGPEHLLHSTTLVWHALTAPVTLGDVPLNEGLGRADEIARELEFLYPIPEPSHPPLGQRGPVSITRGFIKGFIDLVLVQSGRIYVLDWKSDLLASYEAAALAEHVGAHYRIQAELYTLAVVKLYELGDPAAYAARFGGVVYAFVRGMGEPGRGIYFERASWQAVERSERRLREDDLGGPK